MAKPLSLKVILKVEEIRERRLAKIGSKRMTFFCFNGKVRDDRVHCSAGYALSLTSLDNNRSLLEVLKGVCLGVCQSCPDWNGED